PTLPGVPGNRGGGCAIVLMTASDTAGLPAKCCRAAANIISEKSRAIPVTAGRARRASASSRPSPVPKSSAPQPKQQLEQHRLSRGPVMYLVRAGPVGQRVFSGRVLVAHAATGPENPCGPVLRCPTSAPMPRPTQTSSDSDGLSAEATKNVTPCTVGRI